MAGALANVKVLDITQGISGPFCTMHMGDTGAEIIKVEPLKGDWSRASGPPFVNNESYLFLTLNRNKKSIGLDLAQKEGQEVLKRLAQSADIFLEDLGRGAADRSGFGYEALKAINPAIIYAASSGYGGGGPYAHYSAMDLTVQAISGVMAITGFPASPPVKAGPGLSDFSAGIHLYAAIVTALLRRERTGEGCMVEVAMHDTVYPTLTSNLGAYYDQGVVLPRTGNRHGGMAIAPYNTYPTSDGWIAIFCASEGHWSLLCQVMGREDLLTEPRFATNTLRAKQHMEEVDALVGAWTRHYTREALTTMLTKAGVPCGPVLTLDEVADDPNLKHRQIIVELDHPTKGRVKVIGCPLKFFTADGALEVHVTPAPTVGQNTDEVYTSLLGYKQADLDRWRAEGAI